MATSRADQKMRCAGACWLCLASSAAAFTAPTVVPLSPTAPTAGSSWRPATRTFATRMVQTDDAPVATKTKKIPAAVAGEGNLLAELPFPSIYTAFYTAIVVLTARDLTENVAIQRWLADGASFSDVPWLSFSGGAILISYFSFELARMAGLGKVEYYDDLSTEGLKVGSLAQQAAAWANAGEVPTALEVEGRELAVATFGGGCFWGTELYFQRMQGVVATCVGYTQGRTEKPNYAEVGSGTTGHTEGLQLIYDPEVVSYSELCDKLFSTIDASRLNLVGNDVGTQYRHGLYPHTDEQYDVAMDAIVREQARRDKWNQKVVTEVKRAAVFYPAEKYHQRKLQKGGQSAAKGEAKDVRCYG